MKKIIVFLTLLCSTMFVDAQVLDINPNVNWKYVRSQNLELQNGSVYKYEFPAEKGYDYVFTMNYEISKIISYITVVDMQNKPVASVEEPNSLYKVDLSFSVPESSTYKVIIGYKSLVPEENLNKQIELTLIRRPFVLTKANG